MMIRELKSGQEVSYDELPFDQMVALAMALDEWEYIVRKNYTMDYIDPFWHSYFRRAKEYSDVVRRF